MSHQDTTPPRKAVPEQLDLIGQHVVDAAFTIHKRLGPGLLESVYEACMVYELRKRGLEVQSQLSLPVEYDGMKFDCGFKLDLLIEGSVVVELKAVEHDLPVYEAQLFTYLRLTGCRLGYLINFNVPLIRDGIKRRAL